MGPEIISQADRIALENVIIVLEHLGGIGPKLAEVARRATAAILDVVDVVSPGEVDVEWDDDEAA